MCGIIGFHDESLTPEQVENTLLEMLYYQNHRGPDEAGYLAMDDFGMGTSRLSILDLKTGQQPFADPEERYILCYNGELYNYIEIRDELISLGVNFITNSDTEVILQSWIIWKEKAFQKFNGAYAFVIFDRESNDLTLVRDRFGQRPLYYYQSNSHLYFASEIKSFIPCSNVDINLNPSTLSNIYKCWGGVSNLTAFENINQVPNGSYLSYNLHNRNLNIIQYYQLSLNNEDFLGSYEDAQKELKELIKDAVKIRLRSDVEIGTYLSGGLDSTITTALVKEFIGEKLNTYSIAFADKDFDESVFQETASNKIGTKHHILKINNEDIVANFNDAIWHAEVPVFRTALVPLLMLSKKVNEDGIKVAITGEGADESFLGYNIFKETILRSNWKELDETDKWNSIQQLYPYLKHFNKSNTEQLLGYYNHSIKNDSDYFSHLLRFINSNFSRKLLKFDSETDYLKDYIKKYSSNYDDYTILQEAKFIEFNTLLSGYLLSSQGDRVSLANSVENRAPFMDFRIIEFAAKLPENWLLGDNFNEKKILKDVFGSIIPTEIKDRTKQPYRAPDALAFHQNKNYVDKIINEKELNKIEFLNVKFCISLKNKIMDHSIEKISPKLNQAFIFLLSTVILHQQFVQNNFRIPKNTDMNIVKIMKF
jgi:asparagine synthase (glutamine-hydrolysing)